MHGHHNQVCSSVMISRYFLIRRYCIQFWHTYPDSPWVKPVHRGYSATSKSRLLSSSPGTLCPRCSCLYIRRWSTCVQLSLWPETVSIDTAVFLQFLGKLLCHLLMMIRMDIAQGVLNGQYLVGPPVRWDSRPGGTAVALFKKQDIQAFIVK